MPTATRSEKKATAIKPARVGGVAAVKKALKVTGLVSGAGRGISRMSPAVRVEAKGPKVTKKVVGKIQIGGAAYAPSSIINIITGSPEEIIKRTREGLPSSVLVDISDYLDMPKTQLYDAVGVGRSTIAARIKGNQPLSSAESDKVVRMAKVLKRAAEVLDDKEQARVWMRQDIRSIGGVQPITMLDTEAGYELVMDTLGRIEQGIAA